MKKEKQEKQEKQKKQFRLFDIYRYAATGQMSNIEGLISYECNDTATVITVRFEDPTGAFKQGISRMFFANNEDELKAIITDVNKGLGNCMKPGRARRYKHVTL